MPEEAPKEVIPETKPEETVDVISAIIHSFKKDTREISGEIVDNDAVPEEEAIMLAEIQTTTIQKKQTGFFRAMSIFVIVTAVLIFVLPKFFKNNSTDSNPVPVVENKKIINSDVKYILEIPKSTDLDDFRKKVFKSDSVISEFVLQSSGANLDFKSISPLVNDRFIKKLETITSGEYSYGIYTVDKISYPYFILNVKNRDTAESLMLEQERTLYNDFGVALQLPNNIENETRHFEDFVSVRNPLRELKDKDKKTILVYGFATDDILVIVPNKDVFNAIKQRIITGY